MCGVRKLLWCSLHIEKDTSFTVHGFGVVVLLNMINRWYNVYLHVHVEDITFRSMVWDIGLGYRFMVMDK